MVAAALHAPAASVCHSQSRAVVSRLFYPAMSGIAADPADAGQAAASWCVSAGRDQATVAVSRSSTLAGVLKDFWTVARSFAEEEGEKGRQRVLALPCWEDGVSDPELFQKLLQHILDCAEICEYVGDSLMIAGRHPSAISHDGEPESAPCPMLLLRAFTQKALDASTVGDGDSPYGGYDPYADTSSSAMSVEPESITSDAEVIERTREWVEGIICDMKVPNAPRTRCAPRAIRLIVIGTCLRARAGVPILVDGRRGGHPGRRGELPYLTRGHRGGGVRGILVAGARARSD